MYASYFELYFVENPVKIGLTVPGYSHFSAVQSNEIQRKLNTYICGI